MSEPVAKLSPRQRECLALYWCKGATSKEIALELGIAKATVDGYIAEAVDALGAKNRREAARLAFGEPTPPAPIPPPPVQPPAESGGDPARVFAPSDWRSSLPLRTGAHNDLSIPLRLFWIFGLAVCGAVGFGALASGAQLVSNIVR
jgi:DNA-binding CsgD family transcriptional regulator